MSMENQVRAFTFSSEEAESVSRAETGTGDLPEKMSVAMLVILILSVFLRMILDLPLPSVMALGGYAVAITGWLAMMAYVNHRKKTVRTELEKGQYYLFWSETGIGAGRYRDETFFQAGWQDIQVIEQGDRICRITAPAGRLCLPNRILTAEERAFLNGLAAEKIRVNWM